MNRFYEELDPGIRKIVAILRRGGVETFESCDAGKGHCFLEPTVRFHGQIQAGFHALSVALDYGVKVLELRRYWVISSGEPIGPRWEMTFAREQPDLVDFTNDEQGLA